MNKVRNLAGHLDSGLVVGIFVVICKQGQLNHRFLQVRLNPRPTFAGDKARCPAYLFVCFSSVNEPLAKIDITAGLKE